MLLKEIESFSQDTVQGKTDLCNKELFSLNEPLRICKFPADFLCIFYCKTPHIDLMFGFQKIKMDFTLSKDRGLFVSCNYVSATLSIE